MKPAVGPDHRPYPDFVTINDGIARLMIVSRSRAGAAARPTPNMPRVHITDRQGVGYRPPRGVEPLVSPFSAKAPTTSGFFQSLGGRARWIHDDGRTSGLVNA
jgi:hypothetical protein